MHYNGTMWPHATITSLYQSQPKADVAQYNCHKYHPICTNQLCFHLSYIYNSYISSENKRVTVSFQTLTAMRTELVQIFNKLGDVRMVGSFWHVPSLFIMKATGISKTVLGIYCISILSTILYFFCSKKYSANCG